MRPVAHEMPRLHHIQLIQLAGPTDVVSRTAIALNGSADTFKFFTSFSLAKLLPGNLRRAELSHLAAALLVSLRDVSHCFAA